MSSPLPLDSPYTVLGVEKDADLSVIRSRHRKLVLKYHPDRIKDDAKKVEGRDLFNKVQRAYEILSDDSRREDYDMRSRLSGLRKEAMGRTISFPPPKRESQYHRNHEEPKSSRSYFEDSPRYWEDKLSKSSSRKDDAYDRKESVGPEYLGKKKKNARGVKDKLPEREASVSRTRRMERDQQRDRSYIPSRRAYMEEDSSSGSDVSMPYVPVFIQREKRPGPPPSPPPRPPPRRKTESNKRSPRAMPKNDPSPIKKQSESYNSRGRDFWGSDPGSPRQNRQRASSVYSHTSSRNGSLRGHNSFDRGYQQPTYSRPRAGSAASGGSAGSRYDIDRTSPGLPPMPRKSRSYQVEDDDDNHDSIQSQYHRKFPQSRPIIAPHNNGEAKRDRPGLASMPSIDFLSQLEKFPTKNGVLPPEPFPDTAGAVRPDPLRQEPSFPPAKDDKTVDCDVCGWEFKAERKRDWQKHLFEDLRPYICVEDGCQSASETYSTTVKLLAHMKEQHCESEFLTAKNLTCPFCHEDLPQKRHQRVKHVGSHMEDIALASVTRAYEDWTFYSDSENYLSSVCGMEQRGHDQHSESSKPLPDISKPTTLDGAATKADEHSPTRTTEAFKGKEQIKHKPRRKETREAKT